VNLTLSEESGICFLPRGLMAIPIPIVVIGGKEQKRIMPHNYQIQIGYKLTSEEFPARDLVRFAQNWSRWNKERN